MSYRYHLYKNNLNSFRIIEYDNNDEGEIYTLSWVLLDRELYDVPVRNRILNWLKDNHPDLLV